jgi:TolB-like protein
LVITLNKGSKMASTHTILKVFLIQLFISIALFATDIELNENTKYKINGHPELNDVITELADKLFLYNKLSGDNEEIAITSFVDLHQLDKTTHFGRTVSEAFFDELFTRGFNVSDFRGQESLSINKSGEYFLTRDIKLLNKDVTSAYILVGTYSMFEGKVLINARIIDNMSGKVLASARSNYLSNSCKILENCRKPRTINIISGDPKKMAKQNTYAKVDTANKQFFIRKKVAPVKETEEVEEDIVVQTKTPYPLINLIK